MDNTTNNEVAMFEDTDKFKKSLSKSNLIEISAGIFAIIIFIVYAYLFRDKPILISIGSLLIAAGGLYIVLFIIRNRVVKGEMPSREDQVDYFKYWIGWYENTHKLARGIFWWYLLPMIPGFIAFSIGMVQAMPDKAALVLTLLGTTSFIIGGVVYWANRYHSSRKLQIRIDNMNNWISELESK